MEFFLVLLGIIAIVAFVRASNLRRDLDAVVREFRDKISRLDAEIFLLKEQLSRFSHGASPEKTAKTPETAPITAAPPTPEPVVARAEEHKPFETPAVPASAPQRAAAPAPPVPSASIPPAPKWPELPPIPAFTPPPATPAPAQTAPAFDRASAEAMHRQRPVAPPRFIYEEPRPPRKTFRERLRGTLPIEELLGMNIFAKIGIVLLVLGFAFLGQYAFAAMGPGARVGLLFGAGAAMLGAGIRFESKDRYRLVARAGIGGGWAMLFFTTYAMNHVAAMAVLSSNTIDCIQMLLVAAGMVVHTLRYRSQVVTGLAFLLAFSTVALSQDTVYSLVTGVILALGIAAIALRMGWFELEALGIAATYANHFYWLYKLYPDGFAGRSFPEFFVSAAILVCYWAIFRVSYVARKVETPRAEKFRLSPRCSTRSCLARC